MTINYQDFQKHTKKGGQVIKKFRCTCDSCGGDRGYLPKSKAFKNCLSCTQKDPAYKEKLKKTIKAVRSTEESKAKTKQQIKQQMTAGWKPAIVGMEMTLERRIAHSCGAQKITREEFIGFRHELPGYKVAQNFRKALRKCKQSRVIKSTDEFLKRNLGYSFKELKSHLESKFELWMNWDNYGNYELNRPTWQIDHIIPLKFKNIDGSYYWSQEDLTNPESTTFKKAWGLQNLQPLLAITNMSKSNRYISDTI